MTMNVNFLTQSPYRANYFICKNRCVCSNENVIRKQINNDIDEMVEEMSSINCLDSIVKPLQTYITNEIILSPKALRALVNSIKAIKDEYLWKEVLSIIKIHSHFHPPCKQNMREYYEKLFLEDKTEIGEDSKTSYYFKDIISDIEEINFEIYNSKNNIYKRKLYRTVNKEELKILSSTRTKRIKFDKPIGLRVQDSNKRSKSTSDDDFISLIRSYAQAKEFSDFPELNKKEKENLSDKANRLFSIFDWILDILEQDLHIWLNNYRKISLEDVSNPKNFPLIALVAWKDNISSIGIVNLHCRQIFALFNNTSSQYKYLFARYISLLSEVVRVSEDNEDSNFGPKCELFSKELSENISTGVSDDELVESIELLTPHWLVYTVSNYLLEASLTSDTIYSLSSVFELLQRNLTNRNHQPVVNLIRDADDKENKPKKKINKKNHIGETLLHKLCRSNDYKRLEEMMQCDDVDVNIKDNCGWSALHEAVRCNSLNCVQILFKYRFHPYKGGNELNINIRSNDGITPLMIAVNTNNIDIIDLLLQNGAGPTVYIRCNSGQTAVDLAEDNGQIKNRLLTAYKFSTSTFEYLSMSDRELKIFLNLVVSYFKIYSVNNSNCSELDICSSLKQDSLYLNKLSSLVDRIILKNSNTTLKIISLFLKTKLK